VRTAFLALLVALLVAPACDDATPGPSPNDASSSMADGAADAVSVGPDAGIDVEPEVAPVPSFDVTLGTGRNSHVALADGDILYLEYGNQGLQHVLVSIRIADLPQARYRVDFSLVRDDGVAISEPAWVRVPFAAVPDGAGVELTGYQLVVIDPALGIGRNATLRVVVEGPDGGLGWDERGVRVEWAPDGWDPDAP